MPRSDRPGRTHRPRDVAVRLLVAGETLHLRVSAQLASQNRRDGSGVPHADLLYWEARVAAGPAPSPDGTELEDHPMIRGLTLLTAFAALLASALTSPVAGASRPAVLLVMADDLTYHDIGCYGSKNARTPNIDRLAREGMRFTHAFTATAMCSPTRQQLYTGIFPVRNGAYPNHSQVKPGTRSVVHHLRRLGYRVGLAGKWHIGPRDSFPFETVGPKGKLDMTAIRGFVDRNHEEPWCLVVASHSPHLPWTEGDASKYDPQELVVPPYLVDTPETRAALARYHAEVSDLDREVGACLEILAGTDQEKNTLVIFTSEQGAQFPHAKWTCYDAGLRVALIVRWPEVIRAGTETPAMVQYVDVVPTLIEAAGGPPVEGLDGRSFLDVLRGKSNHLRDIVYGVQTTRGIIHGSPCYPIRSARTRTHKLIWNLQSDATFSNVVTQGDSRNGTWKSWIEASRRDDRAARLVYAYQHRPEFELYDLRHDPLELENVADDPVNTELLAELRARIEAWMARQGDEGVKTEMKVRPHRTGRKT